MVDTRITLFALWVAVMLTFLLGDVVGIFAGFFIVFNLVGLPYEGWYDNFLIAVSIVFCGAIIWSAWTWRVSV
jgi:hypothetical protein